MRRQRGVALLVVLLILAIMVVVAGNMSSRFFMELQRTGNLSAALQGKWYALGAEALVAKVLEQDLKDQPRKVHLAQYWASAGQVFPVEGGQLHGVIHDAQACFNLNAINASVGGTPATPDTLPYPPAVFRQLLINLEVDEFAATQITDALRDWIDSDDQLVSAHGAEDAYYEGLRVPYLPANRPLLDVSELRAVRGMDGALYRKLRPLVCALPVSSLKININTLRPEQAPLMAALFLETLSTSDALQLMDQRPREGWDNINDFLTLPALTGSSLEPMVKGVIDVTSAYFESWVQASLDERQVRLISLFQRQQGNKVRVIRRQYGGME